MTIPVGQKWLVERMQGLGYKSCKPGICHGIAHMALHAILADETEKFDKRLNFMSNLSPLDLLTYVDKKTPQLTIDAPDNPWEITAFFDGVELYHQGSFYRHLFESNKAPLAQNASIIMPFVMPQVFDKNPIEAFKPFTGAYTRNELQNYFSSLRDTLLKNPNQEPIAMILGISTHVITVGYNPKKDMWYFIDPNRLPTQRIQGEDSLIADKVLSAFSPFSTNPTKTCTVFSTQIYTKNKENINKPLARWQDSEQWKEIHCATAAKTTLTCFDGTSWLFMAAREGDTDKMSELFKAGADPNQANSNGTTPLYIALQFGHMDIVKQLIENKVNINQTNKTGVTPLFMAAQHGHIHVVKLLIELKADVHKARDDDLTPLYIAAQNGHTEVVKLLLEHKADPNKAHQCGATPLFAAAQNGHFDVVVLLLKSGCNLKLSFNSTKDSLMAFAKTHHVEHQMEAFIRKKGTQPLSVSPEEIAGIMGHSEILNLLSCFNQVTQNKNPDDLRCHALKALLSRPGLSKETFSQFVTLDQLISSIEKMVQHHTPTSIGEHRVAVYTLNGLLKKARLTYETTDPEAMAKVIGELKNAEQEMRQLLKDTPSLPSLQGAFFAKSEIAKPVNEAASPATINAPNSFLSPNCRS
ncbi:ankyrin repeat domain-containing protein [Legionella taurinensis]|uniref:ankyrin repeat domain-containing protein n=1 Tax=Legionella taurinensis TaxID=70611 RepID=UPI00299D80B8|nr:ankyrin repeat domain-containing protein [Legionella taurinensis]MDX1837286.1 ankyrin repeat domain-containing protein [Legionella taurinensis]